MGHKRNDCDSRRLIFPPIFVWSALSYSFINIRFFLKRLIVMLSVIINHYFRNVVKFKKYFRFIRHNWEIDNGKFWKRHQPRISFVGMCLKEDSENSIWIIRKGIFSTGLRFFFQVGCFKFSNTTFDFFDF